MTPSQDWQEKAACRNAPWEIFFPSSPSSSENRRLEAEAVAMCKRCPVREECRTYAETSNRGSREQFGIWGSKNYGPKSNDGLPAQPAWRRPRTLECEICGKRWRWTPAHGYRQTPKTCSARCLGLLRSRIARARDRHGWERTA